MKQVERLQMSPIQSIAEVTRFVLLRIIKAKKSITVNELTKEVDLPQNLVSHHLAVLKRFGVVTVKRKGTFMHYSVDKKTLKKIVKDFSDSLK